MSLSTLRTIGMRLAPLGVAALFGASTAAYAAPAIVSSTTSPLGPLERTEWIVADGPNPIESFRMTRVTRGFGSEPKGAVLLLPSLGTSFQLYEQRDPRRGLGSAITEFLAFRGYDVWGYSPRFEGIPAGTCEAGLFDCSPFADWNIASMVDDVAFVRDQIEATEPGIGVVVGGLSFGAIVGIAVIDADGARYDGLLAWEGMLESNDPAVVGLNAAYCAGLEAQLAGGVLYDAVGGGVFKTIAQHAAATPDGLTPIPLFPPFLTNHQVFVATLSTPAPGPVSQPVPDFISAAADPTTGELAFSSPEKVQENVLTGFNSYTPTVLIRDLSCSLAGSETTYTDSIDTFTGSVLAIGGGRGFGPYMGDQLAAFTSAADVDFQLETDFGHVDHVFTLQHRRYVERPILDWLREIW